MLLIAPVGGPHPFEVADERYFIRQTSNGQMSRLFSAPPRRRDLEAFPMGYTNLWILERALLRVDGRIHRWSGDPSFGELHLFGDDGTSVAVGSSLLDQAEARMNDPMLAGASAIVIARLIEGVFWH